MTTCLNDRLSILDYFSFKFVGNRFARLPENILVLVKDSISLQLQ